MDRLYILDKQKYIFGRLISLPNKLRVIGDRAIIDNEMTIRQWVLIIILAQFGETPPTLNQISEMMGTSHQNVKQIAIKLQKKDFLHIEKDKDDCRTIRLILTKKSCLYWKKREAEVKSVLEEVSKDLNPQEINQLYDCLNKLYHRILEIEKRSKNKINERVL